MTYQLKNFNKLYSTKFFYDAQFNCYRYIITNSDSYILSENDFIEISIYTRGVTLSGECIKVHFWDSKKEMFVEAKEFKDYVLYKKYLHLMEELCEIGALEEKI